MQSNNEADPNNSTIELSDRVTYYLKRAVFIGWLFTLGLYFIALRPLQTETAGINRALDAASVDLANAPIGSPENNQLRFNSLRQEIQRSQRRTEAWLSRVAFSAESMPALSEESGERLRRTRSRRRDQFQALVEDHETDISKNDIDVLLQAPMASGRWSGVDRESGLWAHHETLYQAMTVAALSRVSSISSPVYLPTRPHFTAESDSFMSDLPVYLKVRGSYQSVFGFLSALPLIGDEALEAGLADLPGIKMALFVDSLEIHALKDPLGDIEARVVIIGLYTLNVVTGTDWNISGI